MSVVPEYLRNAATDSGEVVDFRDWGVALGRRFRSLKLWFVLRSYGTDGLAALVARATPVRHRAGGEGRGPPRARPRGAGPAGPRCFAHRDGDDATQRVIDAVQATGAQVTHTRLDGRLVVRVSTGQARTEQRHLDDLWSAIDAAAR